MTPLTGISYPQNYQTQVGLAMFKKVLDMDQQENQKIIEMIKTAALPAESNLGTNVDVQA